MRPLARRRARARAPGVEARRGRGAALGWLRRLPQLREEARTHPRTVLGPRTAHLLRGPGRRSRARARGARADRCPLCDRRGPPHPEARRRCQAAPPAHPQQATSGGLLRVGRAAIPAPRPPAEQPLHPSTQLCARATPGARGLPRRSRRADRYDPPRARVARGPDGPPRLALLLDRARTPACRHRAEPDRYLTATRPPPLSLPRPFTPP